MSEQPKIHEPVPESVLSDRAVALLKDLESPWRYNPGGFDNTFNKETRPDGIISFATAENYHIREKLVTFVQKNVQIPESSLTYGSAFNGGPFFPDLMASHINNYFSPYSPVKPEEIHVGSGLTGVNGMLGHVIGEVGDAILVSRPIYGRFELDFGISAGMKIVYADMLGVEPFQVAVVSRFEQALEKTKKAGIRVRALMITNPSNPLGHCYSKQTLEALLAFCQQNRLQLISDEVYALSVFSPPNCTSAPFTSVLSINTENLVDPNLVHVLYGMSKDFGAAGLKLGCLITRNKTLLRACRLLNRFSIPAGPCIAIANEILKRPDFVRSLIDLSQSQLLVGYQIVTSRLEAEGIPYYRGGNAGFFVYLDLTRYMSHWNDDKYVTEDKDFAMADHMKKHGVYFHPKEEHYEVPGWFRLVFASMPFDVLKIALDRLVTALKVLNIPVVGE
ncbi:hypothetical protein K3495_g6802 [Podosphaera aphanis]|nr:hypothetical protein K3495_g6802 [Podosphaera aphanis]